jgi:hypothetical protein
MIEDNCSSMNGDTGGAIDQNSFADLFPTNWGDFDLDTLSMDKFLGGADLSNALNSTATPQKLHSASSPSDSNISLSPMAAHKEPAGMRNGMSNVPHDPVTRMRTGPGRIPRQRPKPQNLFNVWSQPQVPPPMMAMGYGPTSPYLGGPAEYNAAAAAMMSGGSPPMMAASADPYAWMQAGRVKRPAMNMYGQPSSPSLLYNPYGAQMASPPFGFQSHFPMAYQPPMKLPVHALHRPAETAPPADTASSFMAPIVLPVDLGKSAAGKSDGPVDPSAIPSAITSFLGNGESNGLDENMRLYELTFRSFVKEEAKIDYTNVTVVELKRLLRKYQLAATGKKEELIKMVKDVAEFLKKLPIFKEQEQADSKPEEKEAAGTANQAEANGQDQSIDRFLV